jgi:phage gp16-like protein
MPSFYSPTYYEDRKSEHDFYINLGNQCRIAEEKRQAFKKVQIEEKILQGYSRKLDEAKRVLEKNKKLSHALWEYNYNKDRELILLSDRIAWRDCLPFLSDNQS